MELSTPKKENKKRNEIQRVVKNQRKSHSKDGVVDNQQNFQTVGIILNH